MHVRVCGGGVRTVIRPSGVGPLPPAPLIVFMCPPLPPSRCFDETTEDAGVSLKHKSVQVAQGRVKLLQYT